MSMTCQHGVEVAGNGVLSCRKCAPPIDFGGPAGPRDADFTSQLRAQLAAESAQTLKYQAALARAEERLAAVATERDAALMRAKRAERALEYAETTPASEVAPEMAVLRENTEATARLLVEYEAALSEAAARNGVLLTEIAEARQCLLPGRIEPVRAAAALSRALSPRKAPKVKR